MWKTGGQWVRTGSDGEQFFKRLCLSFGHESEDQAIDLENISLEESE